MAGRDPVVIFGTTSSATALAELVRDEGALEPVAFTVDRGFVDSDEHSGLPLVPFDELAARYPVRRFRALVPIGHTAMMGLRAEACRRLEALGYRLTAWVSQNAAVWSRLDLGPNTIVMPGATVLPFAQIGRDVSVRPNVVVSHHCTIGDHVTLANGAVLGGGSRIGDRSWIGLGAVVRDAVTVAPMTFVGAGATVVSDTERDGVYVGVPARRIEGRSALESTA